MEEEKYQIRISAKKLILLHSAIVKWKSEILLNPPLKSSFFLQKKSGVNLTAVKSTPAMNHNRPHSVALRVRRLPHEGEDGQGIFWNTHVRPLGVMVLSHYASTRPPFLGALQRKIILHVSSPHLPSFCFHTS